MSLDPETFLNLLTLPVLLLLPVMAWVITVLVVAAYIRRISWIVARPRLERPGPEDLSYGMHILLGRLAAAMRAAGFEPIESVHSAGFSGFGGWTQVLYVNPATGERASFINRSRDQGSARRTGSLNLALATEYPPHGPIVTGLRSGWFSVDGDFRTMLADLIVRHRDAVARACVEWQLDTSGGLPVGVAPSRDEAITWLQQRATVVAEAEAKRHGYRLDRSGERYVAPWSLVLRVAAKRMLTPKRRPKRVVHGFDALPASPSSSADSAATPTR
jgi:hypothetical protein